MSVHSYRDDECPQLPQTLPAGQLLPVRRLSDEAVSELATAILGPLGCSPALLAQLQRESEGNTLFLIEVARALAEDAATRFAPASGQTDSSSEALPAARMLTLTGGMLALLKRRLRRVPASEFPWLQLFAVAGRQIDLHLLQMICNNPDSFLGSCADAGVLEVHEESWRFSHDKLREAVLADLTGGEAQDLHRRVGEALEQLYGEDLEHASAIAHHLEQAGLKNRALHYAVRAGEHALRRGALVEALRILQGATQSLPQGSIPAWQTAKAFRLHAQALAGLGRTASCVTTSLRGLRAIGQPVPEQKPFLIAGLVWQAAGQLKRLLHGPNQQLAPGPLLRAEEARLLALVGEASAFALQHLQMAYCMLASTNAADDSNTVEQQVQGYSSLALLLSLTPLRAAANGYFARAEALLKKQPGEKPRAEIELQRLRALVYVGAGKLHAALAQSAAAAQAAARLKDAPLRMFSLLVQRMAHLHLGEFTAALSDGEEIAQLARDGHNAQQLTWALTINGMLLLRLGQLDRAHLELAEASSAAHRALDQAARCAVDALRAQLRLRQGNLAGCRELLRPAIATLLSAKITVPGLLVCFRGLMDTGLSLADRPGATPGDRQIFAGVQKLSRRLQRYASANVLARPAAALFIGLLATRAGDFSRAEVALKRALRTAEELQMPFDQAEAHEALGRLGQALAVRQLATPKLDAAATAIHLATARRTYLRLGAHWHVAGLDGDRSAG